MIKVKHLGRPRGSTWDKNVPRAAYPEIVRRFDSGQELAADIGNDYHVGPVAIRSLVRRYKMGLTKIDEIPPNHLGNRGGLVTSGSNGLMERKDQAEVAAYMQANPGCSTNDIAMCCHMGYDQALRLRKFVEGKG